MKSIIEEMFYGNLQPNTSFTQRGSPYEKALKKITVHEENLLKLLEGPERKMFLEYIDAQSEINALTAVEKFSYGFKLGSLLSIEAFSGLDDLLFEN